MMPYSNENLLKRVVDIQNITLEHKKRGATQKWIFENLIAPRYHISRTTYYSYLGSEAKKILRELEQKKKLLRGKG